RLDDLRGELAELGDLALRLESERDDARRRLAQAQTELDHRDAELRRLGRESAEIAEQLAAERAARERLQAELGHERAIFRRQLEIADGQLRAELDLQRRAFEDHAAAVSRSIEVFRAQLADAREEMDQRAQAERSARMRAEAELATV